MKPACYRCLWALAFDVAILIAAVILFRNQPAECEEYNALSLPSDK